MSRGLEHVYDADRRGSSPLRFLREIPGYPGLIVKNKALVWNFYRREFFGRFRGSALGVLWVLVHPLFLFVTYYLVFGVMFNMRSMGEHPMHYSLYLFVGVIAWTAFVETTVAATTIVVGNGNLIQKVAFPAQLLPLHLVAVNTIVYAVGVVAYLVIAASTGFPLPGIELVGLPIVILIQSLFSLGMALFLAAAYVFIRDINQIYPILVNFWFFATPVFWWTGQFEHNPTMQAVLPWLKLNPMYHILGAHRTVLGVRHGNLGDVFTQCGIALVPAALTFCFGFVLFRSLQHRFADEV